MVNNVTNHPKEGDDITYGDRLRQLRLSRRLTVREVAQQSGGAFSHAYVSNLENGISSWSKASLSILRGFARAFNMSVESLIREVEGRSEIIPETAGGVTQIEVYSWVSGGQGLEGGEVVDYVDIPERWQGQYQAYRIEGDSMAPRIPDGSTIVVKVTPQVHPGQMIVAWVPGHGMVIKLFDRVAINGAFVLSSFNPAYDPIYADEMHVFGYVYEVRTRYPNGNGGREVA